MTYFDNEVHEFSKHIKGSELEGIMLSTELKKDWNLRLGTFVEDSLALLANTDITDTKLRMQELISGKKEELGVLFIEANIDNVEDYVERAHSIGVFMLFQATKETATDEIIESLNLVTASSRKNVSRTIKRWFTVTQGRYFERFIIPKLDSIMEKLDSVPEGERIATLNKLGRDYRKFVKADGYWDAVSSLDTATATIIGQVDYFQETKVKWYEISALMDDATCDVCIGFNGTRFSVQSALDYKVSLLKTEDVENLRNTHPWPKMKDIEEYPDLSLSPFVLPPYHSLCRCILRRSE